MYKLKSFLLVILGFMMIISFISWLMPSNVAVIESIAIPADKSKILSLIQVPEQWKRWHPSLMQEGVEVNTSEKEIVWKQDDQQYKILFEHKDEKGLRTRLVHDGEKDVIIDLFLYEVEGIPQLEWKALHTLKWYPWEKFGGILLKDIVGAGYQQALQNIKGLSMKSGL